jgi:hypothetical protein
MRRMDSALEARDQLSAAREVAARGPQNYLEARLLHNAETLLGQARPRFRQMMPIPWGDLELCLLVAAALYALSLYLGASRAALPPLEYIPLPPLSAEPAVSLPGLPPELNAGQPAFSLDDSQTDSLNLDPPTAQQALDALANALNQLSVTQLAAQALEQGDAAQAANDLRELAEAAQSLDPATIAELAQRLQAAADQLRTAAPEVAEQLDQAVEDLTSGNPDRASEALSTVARLLEDLERAQSPDAQQKGSTQSGDTTQGGSAGLGSTAGREVQVESEDNRLSSEGQIIELPKDELPSSEAGTLQGPSRPPEGESGSKGVSSIGQGAGSGGAAGADASDPLSYPWKWRDVVQGYFSTP